MLMSPLTVYNVLCICVYLRLKSQVKTRMSVLLTEEESTKSLTGSSVKSTGASSISGIVTEGRGGGGRRQSVAAEADVLFSATAGIHTCICNIIYALYIVNYDLCPLQQVYIIHVM